MSRAKGVDSSLELFVLCKDKERLAHDKIRGLGGDLGGARSARLR